MGRFANPYPQFEDSTPTLYAGGKLYFYAAGSSTPQSTYTDAGLSSSNTNPVILNSAGRPATDIFLQDLGYKVVLTDANNNTIWTADNYTSRDSKLIAKTVTGSGSPNGVVAGTAGSSSVLPDFYWDYTNLILYVCTTTGTSSTAVWTGVNTSSAAAVVPAPQGYLTLTTGVPIIPSDVTSATSVYYTPYVGNIVPIYNGASFVPTNFTELQLTLNAAHASSNIYDVFVFNNSGVPTVVTGPSWSAGTSGSIAAGSCVRGTGAGGSALARINGILTNSVQITGRNGATTYTISANLATYVGSLYMDGTNGQISCYRSYGQSRKWGVWNAYNRVPVTLLAGDSTSSWTDGSGTTTIRVANNNTANSLTLFSGLAEEVYRLDLDINVSANANGGASVGLIGFNSTTAGSGKNGGTALNFSGNQNIVGLYTPGPSLGIQVVTMLEAGIVGGTVTFSGTIANHLLAAQWRA